MRKDEQYAAELAREAPRIVEGTLSALYRRHPAMNVKYRPLGKQRCREDIAYHLCTLTEAMIAGDSSFFLKYVAWGKVLLASRNVRTSDLLDCLLLMQEVISATTNEDTAKAANVYLQRAAKEFESFPESPPPFINAHERLADAANSYLNALLSADRHGARRGLLTLKNAGVSFAEICQYIFEPAQREIGRLWQLNQISVAQEHYCTESTQLLMSEMRADESSRRNGRLFVGVCVSGEQHSVGLRMVAEIMESQGWTVYFTGANTPTASVADLVQRLDVQLLGISCATALNLAAVRELMKAVRKVSPRTKIMVGGRMFNEAPDLWKQLEADGFCESASKVPQVALKLLVRKRAAARRG